MGAFYCSICRQTFFCGKGHIFGKSHQSRLRVVLLKFIEKVKEARRTIKKPQVVKFHSMQHEKTFWCYCCSLEVERNVTDGNMTVVYGGLLEHMATAEHRKNTHKFWWDNKADPKLRDKVLITTEETDRSQATKWFYLAASKVALKVCRKGKRGIKSETQLTRFLLEKGHPKRFKAEVAKVMDMCVEKEDELIKLQANIIWAQEKHRQDVLQALLEPEAKSDLPNGFHNATASVEQTARPLGADQEAGPRCIDPMVDRQRGGLRQDLTFIGYQDSSNCGNVHTGALPPWLQDEPLEESSGASTAPLEIGPSLQGFLKQKEQEKLKKLPPHRVGANFDHTSQTDASWLPSFGRVWNSGRRWQSRHQFREEENQKNGQKRRREPYKKTKAAEH